METLQKEHIICYHCGDECRSAVFKFDDKSFCCEGCRLVYDVLQENNLCSYYSLNQAPGVSPVRTENNRFGYLDDPSVKNRLLDFDDSDHAVVSFYIPKMHCSSCIWLLENLHRINPGVQRARVNFLKKEVSLVFRQDILSLRGLVELLAMIGYEPVIRLDDLEGKKSGGDDRSRIYKIGVAGFAFGNIMLFSFPEYLSLSEVTDPGFKGIFSYINFALSLPVFFYCSAEFFRSAWQSIHQKFLNIDVPIALGILVMFVRSTVDIISGTGTGFMDTMAGLVFFMLLGRWFQDKTYRTLSFDRDYKSFFPVSVIIGRGKDEISIPLSSLHIGDRLFVRNEEIIPADAILLNGPAMIDYGFVTGESVPIRKERGSMIYAGGRQKGAMIELEVIKDVSQSYLTQLWNNDRYDEKRDDSGFRLLVNRISHWFTLVIVAVAMVSLSYWWLEGDVIRGWNAFTAVLIIACPCALAISSPFTLGNLLRMLGRKGFYLRDYSVIEKLARVDTIVFDKTGTLTLNDTSATAFEGEMLTEEEKKAVFSLVSQSTHPLSRYIALFFDGQEKAVVEQFAEVPGMGLAGRVNGRMIRVGSAAFSGAGNEVPGVTGSVVYLSIDGYLRGRFVFWNKYRGGIEKMADRVKAGGYRPVVLSGDNDHESGRLKELFGSDADIRFHQTPDDKLQAVRALQSQGRKVLMVGDGLNDAGALRQSDAGISISDDVNNFTPACDGILEGSVFTDLPGILAAARNSRRIILASFILALIYNTIGCWFAVQGDLSPVIAAILMPLSTVTIITFTTGMSAKAVRSIS